VSFDYQKGAFTRVLCSRNAGAGHGCAARGGASE
jgi:hypothetical protein